MDFQSFADGFYSMTCVLSVEKKSDGGCGDIRIVAGNKKFIDIAENPPFIADMDIPPMKFEPDCLYDKYLPKTLDFEDKCYQAAVLKKPIHTYIYLNVVNLWFNMFFWPIDYENENISYCGYSTEPAEIKDIGMTSSSSLTITNDVLKTCIKLRGTNDFKETVNEVIRDIREICDAEVCTLLLVNKEKATSSILAISKAENSTIKTITQNINMYDITMSWLDTIGERDCIVIRNEKDLEYVKQVNNPWYQTLIESRVKSCIIFPLRHNKELLGFIWATNFETENTSRIKETLELTTFFISSEISNYIMVKRLEHISYTDILTGINNRNAMNNRVDNISSGEEQLQEPYGIVFADLNGLKRVNDEEGHSAGDILLKKAALLLQEVFVGDEIYRAGGDEFMVLVQGCARAEFDNKVGILKNSSNDPQNVCFSVGSVFNDRGRDFHEVLSCADEEMYKDKEKYYTEHPERRYR